MIFVSQRPGIPGLPEEKTVRRPMEGDFPKIRQRPVFYPNHRQRFNLALLDDS